MKVLLVPGTRGWAFDHRAKDLMSLNWEDIRFDLKYLRQVTSKDQYAYDLIYPMTLEGAVKLHREKKIPLEQMAAGVTSERSVKKLLREEKQAFIPFLQQLRGINTASDYIAKFIRPYRKAYKTRVGIDINLFRPGDKYKKNRHFLVGWVGRIDKPEYRKLKGYDLVTAALKNMNVDLEIRTYKENYVPRKRLVSFYQKLDCLICSSQSEHIPMPVLEAASCGVPIISTKVGIVPELIQHKENGFIVDRTPEEIRNKVTYLMNHPSVSHRFRKRMRRTIEKKWTLEKCQKEWESFFKNMMT